MNKTVINMDANNKRNHAINTGGIVVPINLPNDGGNAQQTLQIVSHIKDFKNCFESDFGVDI